jgi:hypothetical protein
MFGVPSMIGFNKWVGLSISGKIIFFKAEAESTINGSMPKCR